MLPPFGNRLFFPADSQLQSPPSVARVGSGSSISRTREGRIGDRFWDCRRSPAATQSPRIRTQGQQVVEVAFNAFAQHEAVIAGEFARVVARPQDQVIRLRDDHQFFVPFSGRPCLIYWIVYTCVQYHFHFSSPSG